MFGDFPGTRRWRVGQRASATSRTSCRQDLQVHHGLADGGGQYQGRATNESTRSKMKAYQQAVAVVSQIVWV